MALVTGLQFAVLDTCRLFACDSHQAMQSFKEDRFAFLSLLLAPGPCIIFLCLSYYFSQAFSSLAPWVQCRQD